MSNEPGKEMRVKIAFPVKCNYKGGHPALGRPGRHLWIQDGEVGHGELRLTHSIPLGDVDSVEVTERSFGGTDEHITAMPGLPITRTVGGTAPRQVTEVTLRTTDGHQALWVIGNRGADWTRRQLQPALRQAGIPFFDDLLPRDRPAS
jgi:hypothetical protein